MKGPGQDPGPNRWLLQMGTPHLILILIVNMNMSITTARLEQGSMDQLGLDHAKGRGQGLDDGQVDENKVSSKDLMILARTCW